VLAAAVCLTVMAHGITRRATGFTWGALFAPLGPGLFTGAALVAVLLGVESAVRAAQPDVPDLILLVLQAGIALPVYAALLFASPFADVRALALETVTDFFPGVAARFQPAERR